MKPITAEELSAYLDGELEPAERAELERRLAESPEAQGELEELSGVVGKVRSLERLAPPAELQHRIQRLIDLENGSSGLRGRLARQRGRYMRLPSIIWTLLATVLALAVMTALLAGVFQNRSEPDVIFVQDGPGTEDPAAGKVQAGPVVIGDMTYEMVDETWLPLGMKAEALTEARQVASDGDEGRTLLPLDDERRRLLDKGRGLVLLVDGEWVVLLSQANE